MYPPPRRSLLDPELRRRGIYLLPNLFTTAALFAGFFSIVQAMDGRFEIASIAIFIAMALDFLDGRVARMTRTQSAFGAEYDSLSDMVSFGAAPALVVYEWALRGMGRLGWLAAFVYCAGTALRLARFNTQLGVSDKRYFTGLPSPAAAALVAGLVWVMPSLYGLSGAEVRWPAWAVTLFAGLTMVSNIRYYSFKDLNLRRAVPFWAVLVVMSIFVVLSLEPRVIFIIFISYALSGYVMWVRDAFVRARSRSAARRQRAARPEPGGVDPGPERKEPD